MAQVDEISLPDELYYQPEDHLWVRVEGNELLERYGAEAEHVALDRALAEGTDEETRRFWMDVAKFAPWWREQMRGLDTATRYVECGKYRRPETVLAPGHPAVSATCPSSRATSSA